MIDWLSWFGGFFVGFGIGCFFAKAALRKLK